MCIRDRLRHKVEVISEIKGADLEGRKYVSPFPGAIDGDNHPAAWTVVAADFVTTTDGTGIVHTAVMYGEDDYNLGMKAGFPAQHTVDMNGRFFDGTHPELDGRYVKECDDSIIDLLQSSGKLYSCLLYTSPSPRDKRQSRMPSSA